MRAKTQNIISKLVYKCSELVDIRNSSIFFFFNSLTFSKTTLNIFVRESLVALLQKKISRKRRSIRNLIKNVLITCSQRSKFYIAAFRFDADTCESETYIFPGFAASSIRNGEIVRDTPGTYPVYSVGRSVDRSSVRSEAAPLRVILQGRIPYDRKPSIGINGWEWPVGSRTKSPRERRKVRPGFTHRERRTLSITRDLPCIRFNFDRRRTTRGIARKRERERRRRKRRLPFVQN